MVAVASRRHRTTPARGRAKGVQAIVVDRVLRAVLAAVAVAHRTMVTVMVVVGAAVRLLLHTARTGDPTAIMARGPAGHHRR